jgi:hypothetical protein
MLGKAKAKEGIEVQKGKIVCEGARAEGKACSRNQRFCGKGWRE